MTRPVVETVPATSPIEKILDILHRDGVIVLSDFATEEEIDALNKQAVPIFDSVKSPKHTIDNFRANNTTVFYDLIGKVPEDTSKLLQRKVWHQIMEEFLPKGDLFAAARPALPADALPHPPSEVWDWFGEEKTYRKSSYWLHTSIAYRVAPGAGLQKLHRDQNSSMIQRTGPNTPCNMVSTFVAGSDVTEKNGGTNVIPGSHLWPQDRAPKREECAIVEMKKGSMAIWLGQIFHGAGQNTCTMDDPNHMRYIYGLFACADNFRAGELAALSCKQEDYMKMPPAVLKMLGFYKGLCGSGGLGGIDPVNYWEGLKGYKGGEWIWDSPYAMTEA